MLSYTYLILSACNSLVLVARNWIKENACVAVRRSIRLGGYCVDPAFISVRTTLLGQYDRRYITQRQGV